MIREELKTIIDNAIENEKQDIIKNKPTYHSPHEFLGVFLEEYHEAKQDFNNIKVQKGILKDYIFKDSPSYKTIMQSILISIKKCMCELAQCGAVIEKQLKIMEEK